MFDTTPSINRRDIQDNESLTFGLIVFSDFHSRLTHSFCLNFSGSSQLFRFPGLLSLDLVIFAILDFIIFDILDFVPLGHILLVVMESITKSRII